MVNRARPSMSPADERRHHAELLKKETVLVQELQMATAIMHLIDIESLDRNEAPMLLSEIQQMFPDLGDRIITNGVMARVLGQVGVRRSTANRVHVWQVLDASDRLEGLADQMREELATVRRELGKR